MVSKEKIMLVSTVSPYLLFGRANLLSGLWEVVFDLCFFITILYYPFKAYRSRDAPPV